MELNRKFRFGEEVFIFELISGEGLPRIVKGRIVGIHEIVGSIYQFLYQINIIGTPCFRYRHADELFKSVEEMKAALDELIEE